MGRRKTENTDHKEIPQGSDLTKAGRKTNSQVTVAPSTAVLKPDY